MNVNIAVDIEIPVLYVNPPCNADSRLIEAVSRAGGLGIIDHVTAGPARFAVPANVPYGVRVALQDLGSFSAVEGVRLALIPFEDAVAVSALETGWFAAMPFPVLVEIGSADQALAAGRAGAAGLVARGNEGPGWVSETSGLVLIQEILAACQLPLFLQGGVGFRTAAGAVAAGAAGVVLDVHLLLAEESSLDRSLKDFLGSLGLPATVTLAEGLGTPLRVYSRVGTKAVRDLRKQEDSLAPEQWAPYREQLTAALRNPATSPDSDESLIAMSEDIVTARNMVGRYRSAGAIVAEMGRRMSALCGVWPFGEGAGLCSDHRTSLPLVQGPMAHVSDNPGFLGAVAAAGALPFLAMGNMPGTIAREALQLAAERTNGKFGVGIIGLEVNRHCYEAHIEMMAENPPPFAILAAGSPDLARRIDEIGTTCYLHCPLPAVLVDGLGSGLRRFVFEGCESGGHIGTLGSLNLWTANLDEIETASGNGVALDEVTILFAGGIAGGRGAAFVAGMVADLAEKGLKVGLQMGTAYLATREAVSTCAITPTYQKLTIDSDRTVVIGRTVNTRARAAGSPMATQLIERENERLRAGVPLRERKELYEKDNLGALRLASKGCAIDPETATWDCPVFCDLPPEEQLNRGLYLMGQVVALLEEPRTIDQLHEEILEKGRSVFESTQRVMERASDEVDRAVPAPRLVEMETEKEPIAVVGIGLRVPGSDSPQTYWDQIVHGRSGIGPVPEERWERSSFYYDPDPKAPDKTYSRIGGFLKDFTFDPLKYRIPPAVAKQMDRTQQIAVTCVADALADAGLTSEVLKGKRVGIIIGNSMGGENSDRFAARVMLPRAVAHLQEALEASGIDPQSGKGLIERFRSQYLQDLPEITEDSLPGELANVISGRIANVFNLEGPNFTVDAACASSMAAVMNAMAGLRNGTMDLAVSGGVDAAMNPASFVKFCKIGALSPDGSRPFDASANGFVMGEGAGILILKRLSDAIRDNDRIYATILEVGSSSDGKGKGITAPNAAGQERAVRACFDGSGVSPASVTLIEAHGTSTAVGDTTELTLLDGFFRSFNLPAGSVGVGSVKSQIGHLKAAAGAAGMIKTVLSLHHKTLPPTINVNKPNPCIDWNTSPLRLLTSARSWESPAGAPRRAGVSAFGFGGTNFHVLMQEHVPGLRVVSAKKRAEQRVEFVRPNWPQPADLNVQGEAWVISENSPGLVAGKIKSILDELTPANFIALAARDRDQAAGFDIRFGFAAADAQATEKKLALILEGLDDPAKRSIFPARGIHMSERAKDRARKGVAFLFPGQGSQYPFMLRDLAERFPVVAQTFQEADDVLTALGLPAVTASTFPRSGQSDEETNNAGDALRDTQTLQPVILTANTALFRLLAGMGVHPVACAGHSLGEYAACVAAGVFSFKDALEAVAVRGREMSRVSIADPGIMMSIPADARLVEEVLAEVDGYVVAANKNSPKQTVISGETAAVKKAAEMFGERGLEAVLIPVSAAFHSGVVAPAREPFMKTLEKLAVNPPVVPVLSNVTGDFYPVGPAAPGRIRDLLGKQFAAPVEWVKSLRRLYSEGIRIFLECGPKRVLTNLSLDTLSSDVLAMPTNHPKKGGILQLMETLAALAAEGMPVDFTAAQAPTHSALAEPTRKRPDLRVVSPVAVPVQVATGAVQGAAHPLQALIDDEIREIGGQREFARFLEMQGEPIRGLIKSGFQTFVKTVLPLEKTVRQVESEGMAFEPVVISGTAAGLPSDVRFPFDKECLDDLILGRNFIKKVPDDGRRHMLEKNVERLFKGPAGEAELRMVDDISGVIKLAGFFGEEEFIGEYGWDERLVKAMDVTTRLAVAAGIEALRDAGIPLVLKTRTTSTGQELPESWALPEPLRAETGVIFASAFPGMASLVDEVTRSTAARYGAGAKKRLIDFYTGLVQRIRDDRERERITKWFTEEFSVFNPDDSEDLYSFNRDFLLKVMSMGHAQLAQMIKAQGPNSHVDAACAGTTQAVLMARDWIRTGQAKRVIVVAADDVAGKTLLPWMGSGFLAMGAATTNGNLSEAALPFDDRRHGLILGSAAVGLVLEGQGLVKKRGMEAIASIEAGVTANSGYHGTRLDQEHITTTMETMIGKWEVQSGLSRDDLAKNCFFMSHETYSPKRGGSSAAEVRALRGTFGDKARMIPIANTKGYTGHTMGVGVEDVVALRCLQKRLLPPIANLRQPDPEFADMNLSRGGASEARYALRLAAGFGSQIVMALYKVINRDDNRITDFSAHRAWLKRVTGYIDPVVSVENRSLRVIQRPGELVAVQSSANRQAARDAEPAAQYSSKGHGAPEVRTTILELLSKKTGYPAEMLDTGLDLEADLGIDTVKQAEFISEVREAFSIPRIDGLKIADFPTIEHIIEFVLKHTQGASAGVGGAVAEAGEGSAATAPVADEKEVRDKILSLLSNKTGYPADMLDPELDLEADLGIDTVKQAEFITEVREIFGIPRIEGLKIADFPTINHLIGFVLDRRKRISASAEDKPADKPTDPTLTVEDEVHLLEARLVALPDPEQAGIVPVDEVLIAGGAAKLVGAVEEALLALGYQTVRKIPEPSLPVGLEDKRVGIVNLFPMENAAEDARKTFELYLSAAKAFERGPAFLVAAVSEDGAYGFAEPNARGYLAGIAAGATKSFSREYPDARVRMLDLHPDLGTDRQAQMIARSLAEAFPLETAVGRNLELRAVRLVPFLDDLPEPGVKSGDVVLVSGGAGGITAACIKHLAEYQSLTFVILDRTSLSGRAEQFASFGQEQWEEEKKRIVDRMKRDGKPPTPVMVEREVGRLRAEAEAFRNVQALRSAGSEVIFRSLDIRDAEAVDRAVQDVAETCGRVDIVIHAAGIDISRALRTKTLDQIENVVSVKVDGMRCLLESLSRWGLPPRRIVGFGSVAGRFGNLAQIDYSAANDGLAHQLRWADGQMDAKVSIIDWSPWSEIGMATRGSVQQTLEAAGIDFVSPRKGVDYLARELGRYSGSCEAMAAGRLGPFAVDAFEIPGCQRHGDMIFAGAKGQVVTMIPGEYVKARITLDPMHPVLDHHRIDRAAVLPGVAGMETMRTAAGLLNPDVGAIFEEVRFRSPLKMFKDDPFEAEVEVVRIPGTGNGRDAYKGRITSWFVDRQGRKIGAPRVHHECLMVVGPAEPAVPEPLEMWNQSVWISEQDIYKVFFHGPGFRFLDHVVLEGNGKGVRFRYGDTSERPKMFLDMIPGAVEAAFQAGAAYGLESRGLMALPVGIERATIYRTDSLPYEGELVPVQDVSLDGPEGRAVLRFNGVVRDRAGEIIVTLSGIEMIELEAGRGFPRRIFEEILQTGEIMNEMEADPGKFLDANLSEEEAHEHASKPVRKRADEWLTGRVALKSSVQRLLAASGSNKPPRKSIRIVQDDKGKPIAELSTRPGVLAGDVSLSHSNGLVVAASAAPGAFEGLGVDVEKVEPRSDAWAGDYFTDEEIRAAGDRGSLWVELTKMWCLKEAALKALGTGLRFDLRDVSVASLDERGRARLDFHNEAARYLADTGLGALEARVEERDDLVIARALIRRPEGM